MFLRSTAKQLLNLEARGGIEPPLGALQAPAFPLGDRASTTILDPGKGCFLPAELRQKAGNPEQKNSPDYDAVRRRGTDDEAQDRRLCRAQAKNAHR